MSANTLEKRRVGAMELLGIIGFSLLINWFACNFLWFFANAPADVPQLDLLISQWLLIVGFVLGNILNRFIFARFMNKKAVNPIIIAYTVVAALYPSLILIGLNVVIVPSWFFGIVSVLAGFSSSHLLVGWMDFCGKARVRNYQIFVSMSFVGASILFILCFLTPVALQPIFSVVTVAGSTILWLFLNARADTTSEVVERKRSKLFSSPQELEPLLFVFGLCFGVFFVLMFDLGTMAVLWGMLSMILGSLIISALALARFKLSVITLFRVVVVVLVAICLIFPFGDSSVQIVCCSVITCVWVVFTVSNYANIIKQITERKLNLLYNVSSGLIPKISGFAVGWLVTTIIVIMGLNHTHLTVFILGLAFILVLTSMVFYPTHAHHDVEASESAGMNNLKDSNVAVDDKSTVSQPAASPMAIDEQILQQKCEAVARQFLLSPREADVLNYLVRGRNADYIRNKLVLSPHTVKSHIANIYRKTDIHNQQKLMVFVEEFELVQINIG